MRLIGTIVVANAALLSGGLAAVAAPAADSGAGTQIITPHAFASGIDVQTGRSATIDSTDGISDKYRFSTGFIRTSACDTPRIEALFCRDQD